VDDCFWTDIGTLEDYLFLHAGLLLGNIPAWPELAQQAGHPFLIADKARRGSDPTLLDWVCVGEASIGRGVHLQRSVVWDGAVIEEGSRIVDQLVAR
jgi:NDP-sugar pyrophosphorylase family protein